MTRQEKINVKASRYLDHIIKITGALRGYDCVRYDTAEYEFWIYPDRILRRHKVRRGELQTTCWKSPKKIMPYEEALATVLLLLHDSPKHFEVWRAQARGERLT